MKTKLTSTSKAWLIAGLSIGAAFALPSCRNASFKAADTDKSGTVSSAEFERFMLEAIFIESDGNGDGKVTFEEWKAAYPDAETKKFKAPDRNRDGSVSPPELKRHFARFGTMKDLFRQIDTNKDGQLTEEEITTFTAKVDAQSGSTKLQRLSQASS